MGLTLKANHQRNVQMVNAF